MNSLNEWMKCKIVEEGLKNTLNTTFQKYPLMRCFSTYTQKYFVWMNKIYDASS